MYSIIESLLDFVIRLSIFSFNCVLKSEKNEIQNIKTVLNDMIDCMQNIFTYLSEHKNKWTIQNQMFYFEDDESLIEYNKLLTQLQEKIDSAENILSNENTEEENSNSTNKQQ